MSKQKDRLKGRPVTCEGDYFSPKVTDEVFKIFPKVGAYIPRLIAAGSDDEVYLDVRMWFKDQNDELCPTGKGFRFNLRNVKGLYRTLKMVKSYLEDNGIWDEIE